MAARKEQDMYICVYKGELLRRKTKQICTANRYLYLCIYGQEVDFFISGHSRSPYKTINGQEHYITRTAKFKLSVLQQSKYDESKIGLLRFYTLKIVNCTNFTHRTLKTSRLCQNTTCICVVSLQAWWSLSCPPLTLTQAPTVG